jgi:hypothetical protein
MAVLFIVDCIYIRQQTALFIVSGICVGVEKRRGQF